MTNVVPFYKAHYLSIRGLSSPKGINDHLFGGHHQVGF
jgi:hypothetical protein